MHPTNGDDKAWVLWAVEAYLTIGQERELDRVEETCVQKLKNQGVIR